jgi:superfamily II DNA or RNA helicase
MEKLTIAPGDFVRMKGNPSRAGILTQTSERRGRYFAEVRFTDTGLGLVPFDQIELVPSAPDSLGAIVRKGNMEGPAGLRRNLAHERLSGRLTDVLYSLEASETDFFAHQFKPVLKLLGSPTGHLLIADEVGLGKTIEAGLIWTELVARLQHRRLLVVCPKVLCEKWKLELETKFGLDARIFGPAELLDALRSPALQRRGFVAICSLQGLRAPQANNRSNRGADQLATFCEDLEAFDFRIDMLIVDEAHHLRNPGTQTNLLGHRMARIAQHVVMLSATPINLRNRDLHTLLRLADPVTFREERALDDIVEANAPIIAARDALIRGASSIEVVELLDKAALHPLLAGTSQLGRLREEVTQINDLGPERRADLAARLEGVNLLANVVSRTRRRDVDEFRVARQVSVRRAIMSDNEREVYDAITAAVLAYANARNLPHGFLTVTPQRMLASCLPAALAHWRADSAFDVIDEEEDEEEKQDSRPLRTELARMAAILPASSALEAQDSKFRELLVALRLHQSERPSDKIVVFSTFRPTLAYLTRRLAAEGFGVLSMTGLTGNRTELVEEFRTDTTVTILLSSEVGSEGIDLQFATTVINYDLPWNPMRIEQRIGRVDRLGQKAEAITVVNLLHNDTIDDRIYRRLYERLGLCQTALGGFEEILGQEVASLTRDLLSGKLSMSEQEARIDQAAQVIAMRRSHEDALERDAGALVAHGDYIIQEIRNRRDEGQMVTHDDLADYLDLGLGALHAGCEVVHLENDARIDLRLTGEARASFETWGQEQATDPGPLARTQGTISFRVGRGTPGDRRPRLGQSHPIVRYISQRLTERGVLRPPAVAMRSSSEATGLKPGIYAAVVQAWSFGRGAGIRLASEMALLNGIPFESGVSERAIRRSVRSATPWTTVRDEVNLGEAGDCIESLLDGLRERFAEAIERQACEIADRITIQIASLERGVEEDRNRIRHQIEFGPERMRAANKGRLSRLEERFMQRRISIEAQQNIAPESREVAAVLLKVEV